MDSVDMTAKQFQMMCRSLMDSSATVVVEGTKLRASSFLAAFIASWEFDAFIDMARTHSRHKGRKLGDRYRTRTALTEGADSGKK